MSSHVFRPLIVFVLLVAAILGARSLLVPRDFGVGPTGYMYGWHRKGNESEWKTFKVKYTAPDYCKSCHAEQWQSVHQSVHAPIDCQSCHGPAREHPDNPPKLKIDRSRELCLRCHSKLDYPASARSRIRGIDPKQHNPGLPCADCHNPHQPQMGGVS